MKLLLILCGLFLTGCGWDNCNSQIDDAISSYGNAEEITKYDNGTYHNWSYWWYSKGISYSFVWDKDEFSCEVSTYQFDPIKYKNNFILFFDNDNAEYYKL